MSVYAQLSYIAPVIGIPSIPVLQLSQYQTTGLIANLDIATGISIGTDGVSIRNTSGSTKILNINATYDAEVAGGAQLGIILVLDGSPITETEARETQLKVAKLLN
jgi:hypothetical protein